MNLQKTFYTIESTAWIFWRACHRRSIKQADAGGKPHVFHDFQADNFNINHIVVGPAGVFAIETKARSKAVSGDGKKDANAIYNGREIMFSNFNDTKYLDQAKRQAKWLSTWLKSAVGEPVDVFPVISLPGFYVERKAPYDGIFVINPSCVRLSFCK